MGIEDEHLDVLQNLEGIVSQSYREDPLLTDFLATRVYEALIDTYVGERIGREPRQWNPSAQEMSLYNSLRIMCEFRLGRNKDVTVDAEGMVPLDVEPIDVETLINCLKRLRKSVIRWNKRGGPQGYLDFIVQFV